MSRRQELIDLSDCPRLSWDPTEEPVTHTRTGEDIDVFELHHTGAPGPSTLTFAGKQEWLLSIERYHEVNKGWSDIFYHVFVFADGEIWMGRDIRRTSQANLADAVTVHIPGDNPIITEAQHASLLRVARWATTEPAKIRGHRDRAATACPGNSGAAEVLRLREELNMATSLFAYPGIVRRGSSLVSAVKLVQSAVGTASDGVFGPATEAAVKRWQQSSGLTADGIVGFTTWVAMFPVDDPAPAPGPEAHNHSFENLAHLPEAKDAKANGLWDGSDPDMAASRSTVAVIAQRALSKSHTAVVSGPAGKDGAAGPAGKDGAAGPAGKDGTSPSLDDIVEVVVARLLAAIRNAF